MGRNKQVGCNQCQKLIRSDHLLRHMQTHKEGALSRRLQQLNEEVNDVRKNPNLAEVASNQIINKLNNELELSKPKQWWSQQLNFIATVTENETNNPIRSNRQIGIWLDPEGNTGKTTVGRWLGQHYKDIIYLATTSIQEFQKASRLNKVKLLQPNLKFIINIPRSQEVRVDLLETLLDGQMCSGLYSDPCQLKAGVMVFVLCNNIHWIRKLSKDRPVILKLDKQYVEKKLPTLPNKTSRTLTDEGAKW